ncbi:hypothetical protein BC936DRAFT_137831 [Jimgerdemannia flammicorona]|uniref:Vacuolar membrane-associated protein IML1 n=1 Tax=Jimgerdemannia flammicorona TaxID=994334 RepID=A0A433CWK4_9FUNG|nr:hypothetical protein BC936DRAFT_137831 [Jimgerdemannia flammicorona]
MRIRGKAACILRVTSGYVTDDTHFIFRSESAKFFILIHMCREMWDFDEDGDLFFEKAVHSFLPDLFHQWSHQGTNHIVSIVLFTRILYSTNDVAEVVGDQGLGMDESGQLYRDFYKVIADWEARADWMTIIEQLKEEFLLFQREILMRRDARGYAVLCGRNSLAFEGNVLEAVNMVLNPFDRHHVDRDLMRTGLAIVMITPGLGKFNVERRMLRMTTERMMDNGITLDLVCLGRAPLHIVPLFLFKARVPKGYENKAGEERDSTTVPKFDVWDPLYYDDPAVPPTDMARPLTSGLGVRFTSDLPRAKDLPPPQTFYAMPHWIDVSYYAGPATRFVKPDKYVPRCKMYEMQMMGIMEHEIASISIPYLVEEAGGGDKVDGEEDGNEGEEDEEACLTQRDSKRTNSVGSSRELNGTIPPTTIVTNLLQPREPSKFDYDGYDDVVFCSGPDSHRPFKLEPIAPPPLIQIANVHAGSAKIGSSANGAPRKWTQRHSMDVTETLFWAEDREDLNVSKLSSSAPMTPFWPRVLSPETPDGAGTNKVVARASQDEGFFTLHGAMPLYETHEVTKGRELTRRNTASSPTALLGGRNMTPTAAEDDESSPSAMQAMPIPKQSPESRRDPSMSNPMLGGPRSSPTTSYSFPTTSLLPSHSPQLRHTTKQAATINPCNPSKNMHPFTSHLRRWQHALPTPSQPGAPIVHWVSMCTPACLPLTTDYFPSAEELARCYRKFTYTVSVSASEDVNLYQAGDLSDQKRTENLLTELMSQRLAQGFQLIVPAAVAQHASTVDKDKNFFVRSDAGVSVGSGETMSLPNTLPTVAGESLPDGGLEIKPPTTISVPPYYLSMGHHVHKLGYDATGQKVMVTRYVRNINYANTPMSYSSFVWPRQLGGYRVKEVTFGYPNLSSIWNYLDYLVAGHRHELTDDLRYWRARFLLIPMETLPAAPSQFAGVGTSDRLDDEELRLEYFRNFLQGFRRAEWLSPREREEMKKKRKELNLDLGLQYTTMDPTAYILNEVRPARAVPEGTISGGPASLRRGSIAPLGSQLLNRDATLPVIATAMQSPVAGVKMQTTRWHVRLFENVFVGSEFVEWLIREFADVDTREDAVAFGNRLMEKGLFEHSLKRHRFLDGHYFYQLKSEYAPKTRAWFSGVRKATAPNAVSSTVPPKEGIMSEKTNLPEITTSPRPSSSTLSLTELNKNDQPPTFEMTKQMIIDVDLNKKSNRRETAFLHYDTVHNVRNCYHFQLNWLGCNAQLINDLLRSWAHTAERWGLKLIEASVDQAYAETENGNPFQCPALIRLAVPPPEIPTSLRRLHPQIEIPHLFFETELAKHHGFVLDVEADTRFPKDIQLKYTYLKTVCRYDQYVHVSGVAFVQVAPPGEGFFWVCNRLYTSHVSVLRPTNPPPHPDTLRRNFEEFCMNAERLGEFWEHTLNKLSTRPGMAWILENQKPEVVAAESMVTPVLENQYCISSCNE